MSYAEIRRSVALGLCLAVLGFVPPVSGSSYIYQPLAPPKAEDITAFSNRPVPGTSPQRKASREEILRFLRRGKNNLNISAWHALEFPKRMKPVFCEGLIVDRRGQMYVWKLRTSKVLKLETEDGRTALLQLR